MTGQEKDDLLIKMSTQAVLTVQFSHCNILFCLRDGDGVLDTLDNCVEVANGDQQDTDNDELG